MTRQSLERASSTRSPRLTAPARGRGTENWASSGDCPSSGTSEGTSCRATITTRPSSARELHTKPCREGLWSIRVLHVPAGQIPRHAVRPPPGGTSMTFHSLRCLICLADISIIPSTKRYDLPLQGGFRGDRRLTPLATARLSGFL